MRLSMRPNLIGPLLLPVYWVMILTEILIMGLLAVSFNLLLGYTGLLSFGHGAFFGLGAYTCALLLQAGFFSVRLDEIFSAMITLGMGMLFFPIAHNWLAVTGGSDGLPVFALPVLNLAGREFTFYAPNSMYYLVFVTVLAGLVLLWLVVHSPFGLILRALRENKQRVAFIGGTGVFLGPLFGAAIFFGLEQLIIHFTENWMFFLGIVLIPIVLFFPQGVFGTLRNRFFRQG